MAFNSFYVIEYLELALGNELTNMTTPSVLLLISQLSEHIPKRDLIAPEDNYSLSIGKDIPRTTITAPHIDYIVEYSNRTLEPILKSKVAMEKQAEKAYYGKEHFLKGSQDYKVILKDLQDAAQVVFPMFTKIKTSVCARCNTIHDPRVALKPILAKIYQNLKLEKINTESGFFAL